MLRYIIRRLIQAIPTLFGITVLSFTMMYFAPGDPLTGMRMDPSLTRAQRELVRERSGIDDPLPVQYLRWLVGDLTGVDTDGDGEADYYRGRGVLRGDFGFSLQHRRPVLQLIADKAGATLELGLASLLIGLTFGIPIGILAAVGRGSWFDNLTRITAVLFNAIPIFWLGILSIFIFAFWLNVLPSGDRCDLAASVATRGCPPIWQRLDHLLLPALVLSTGTIAGYSRFMRASMLDVINQDYIRTAKAKGLAYNSVWFLHGARNALIPLATFLGPTITGLLGGAVITESIFAWPGLGTLSIQAVNGQDYPLVMAFVIIGALSTIAGYVLSDVLYAWIDPRIRFS
jgi:peptide/nickel transport system permease protein